MLAIWVKVRVKADQKDKFLKAIEHDALGRFVDYYNDERPHEAFVTP